MKVLPISNNPYIKIYTHHMFSDAIINNERTVSGKLATIALPEENMNELTYLYKEAKIEQNGNRITINSEPYELDVDFFAYRKIKDFDTFIVCIEYQQYVSIWGNIGIFVTDKESIGKCNDKYSFINFCQGSIYSTSVNIYNMENYRKQEYPLYLKLCKTEGKLSGFYSYDLHTWNNCFNETINEEIIRDYYVGVNVSLSDNQYHNWVFANYIQLMLSNVWTSPDVIPIDYYVLPQRDYSYFTVHNLAKFKYETVKVIADLNLSIMDYIMLQIDNNFYVEVQLNERYIVGRNGYYQQWDRNHPNLVYGYDENEKVFYILGYNKMSKPVFDVIPFDVFQQAYESTGIDNDIKMYNYSPDKWIYRMDIEEIMGGLKAYLEGSNSSIRNRNLFVPLQGFFGVDIYEEFTKDEECLLSFIKDKRISYILFEHKKIMRDRIQYLITRKVLTRDALSTSEIVDMIEQIYLKSSIIKSLVIKSEMKNSDRYSESVKKELIEMRNIEIVCYSKLYKLLKQYINQ